MLHKCSIWRVLEVFFKEPRTQHLLIDITRKAKLAHTSVKKHLKELESEELITVENKKQGTRNFPNYKANYESEKFKQLKILHNLNAIRKSGIIQHIYEKHAPKTIILFGSYSRGEDNEQSDIDLFIEISEKNEDLSRFEKKLRRNIQTHYKESFNKYPKELKNNILNGIVLAGYLKG